MDGLDLFAVEVDGERLAEGDDRQRSRGGRIDLRAADRLPCREALPHVVVGDDVRLAAEDLVATGVVAVPVGVENEFELASAEPFQGRLDLVRERRELVVHDQDAVLAHRHPDVAARSLKHVDVAGHGDRLDLHLRKVPVLRLGRQGGQGQARDQPERHRSPHSNPPQEG
jgi:hypothetical protein